MITLVQFPTVETIPNLSPFCVKAETLLRMAKLEYGVEEAPDPSKGKKGKLPMIRDEGSDIADSELIRFHLENKHGVDFDSGLSATERAQAHAFGKMVEERTYWCLVYDRWIIEENWQHTADFWFGSMPWPIRPIIKFVAQRTVRKGLHMHGLGRHSKDEIFRMARRDLDALAAQIGDDGFLIGDKPCGADAVVFGCLANLSKRAPLPSDLSILFDERKNLGDYVERCMKEWYPEKA